MFIPLVHVILPVVTLEVEAEADQDTGAVAGETTKLLVFIFSRGSYT